MFASVTLETRRLRLRRITPDDAAFIVALLNEPDFLRFIGDRKVRTEDDARAYFQKSIATSYEKHGFGMLLVIEKSTGAKVGMCGLVKRDFLEDPDVGFAFLAPYRQGGYGFEAANEILRHAREDLHLTRVLAIASKDNEPSRKLLAKFGLFPSADFQVPGEDEVLFLFTPARREP